MDRRDAGGDGDRLVLIERNEVRRVGRTAVAVAALPPGWLVDGWDPELLRFGGRRDGVAAHDVAAGAACVLVTVEADGGGFDRFDLVEVVAEIVDGGPDRPAVLVAAPERFNPMLEARLAAAGADLVVGESWLASSGDGRFAAAVERARAATFMASSGTDGGFGTDPTAVLRYVTAGGFEQAFEPGRAQNQLGLSRRTVLRIRRDIARLGAIRPSLDRFGGGSHRDIDLPTWREVVAYVNCARGVIEWDDDAWGHGPGPRIGVSRYGLLDLEAVARGRAA